ncbi:MAG: NUDIX hydrolase [Chloroflexota bacterium]
MTDIEPEHVLALTTVFEGELFTVYSEAVELPKGGQVMREVVSHPSVVGMLPILADGRIVLVRQYRLSTRKVLLEIPAGAVEKGEKPEDAALRELAEETGYRAGSIEQISSFYTSPGYSNEYLYLYRVENLEAGLPTEHREQIQVVKLTVDEAMERAKAGEVDDAKTLLALQYAKQL